MCRNTTCSVQSVLLARVCFRTDCLVLGNQLGAHPWRRRLLPAPAFLSSLCSSLCMGEPYEISPSTLAHLFTLSLLGSCLDSILSDPGWSHCFSRTGNRTDVLLLWHLPVPSSAVFPKSGISSLCRRHISWCGHPVTGCHSHFEQLW